METLQTIRAAYERIYGKTAPCCADMIFGHHEFSDTENYLGCELEGNQIRFRFSPKAQEHWHDIEMHFRNRLSRKISFAMGDEVTTVYISDFMEERAEYLTAAMDLDNYFRGKEPSLRLQAEYRLYCQDKDWRNADLLRQEMSKM